MVEMYKTAAVSAMEMMKSQIPQAQNPLETLRTAKEILAPAALAEGGGLMNDFLKALIPVLVEKLVNPADPLKAFSAMADVMKTTGLLGGAKSDMGTALVSVLPRIAEMAVDGVKEYRLASENDLRVAELQRGVIPVRGSHEVQPNPSKPAAQAPEGAGVAPTASAPSATNPGVEEVYGPDPRWVLIKIAERVKDPQYTGGDIMEFMDGIDPRWIEQLRVLTPEALHKWFRDTPILKTVADHPRLPQLIKEFLEAANRTAPAEAGKPDAPMN
jgi:hypothetical protein